MDLTLEIKREAFAGYLEALGGWDEVAERARQERNFPKQRFYLVNGDAGVIALEPDGDVLLLRQLFIRPGLQGNGLGSQCLAWVIEQAEGQPIRLRVMKSNPDARRFYERHGFAAFDETDTHVHLVRSGTP